MDKNITTDKSNIANENNTDDIKELDDAQLEATSGGKAVPYIASFSNDDVDWALNRG